uniref:RNase H type-1 domain-containing protein n=1 Tax=Ananas comosus var. bracteatus TaxID=296719 RepID=A0A6V7PYM2_ANACO|nr:unnamed protein product [Ananas comosus var. bracteatus]
MDEAPSPVGMAATLQEVGMFIGVAGSSPKSSLNKSKSSPGQSLPLGMLPYLTQVPRILGQASSIAALSSLERDYLSLTECETRALPIENDSLLSSANLMPFPSHQASFSGSWSCFTFFCDITRGQKVCKGGRMWIVSSSARSHTLGSLILTLPGLLLTTAVRAYDGTTRTAQDGCSKGNPGPAAAVGVLRNCNGEWIMGFVNNLGITQNFAAEFGAIYHGLSMAWDLGYRHLILESDSKTCLSCITQAVPSTHPKELT